MLYDTYFYDSPPFLFPIAMFYHVPARGDAKNESQQDRLLAQKLRILGSFVGTETPNSDPHELVFFRVRVTIPWESSRTPHASFKRP